MNGLRYVAETGVQWRYLPADFPPYIAAISSRMHEDEPRTILTVGHSTKPIHEFAGLLHAHGVKVLVDVRTIPRSRHNPQFEQPALSKSLSKAGIDYQHMKDLAGLRKPRLDSINAGWRNKSFPGYADYMQTPEFTTAIDNLITLAHTNQVALMCAEAVPWRCHRSLIADALVVRGVRVEHIMSATKRDVHHLRSFAKRAGLQVTYPPEEPQQQLP